ncbi:hypothetical protein HPB52_019618 [Rhipicephalus sanguineus]|uniref:Uncharacterized protein n=1 Tax=Rhipicephalus sanguineus TaxID=34632 RepID=A0A9D4SQV3_RHISA|nr:hypothetical protein HPB52_019618 [Rhipicephalus sanguineus]
MPQYFGSKCSICGTRQHEDGTPCPNVEPKCRSSGGSLLATATNCPKRREVNKKIEQKRKPAAKRQRKKRPAQEQQRRNPETEKGSPKTILKPTRRSFYNGPLAPSSCTPASGAQAKHPRRNATRSTRLPPPNDHPHLPAPTIVQDIERHFENRIAQIEKSIHENVEQLISRATEKCVHAIMERIMLSGMLPLGTA